MPEDRYLELLKSALTYELYDEPGVPISWLAPGRRGVRRWVWGAIDSWTRGRGLEVVRKDLPWPRSAHTMVPRVRLDNLEACLRTVLTDEIAGDVIECGVWRGGCSIFARACLDHLGGSARTVWMADSFRGLPSPDQSSNAARDQSRLHLDPLLSVPRAQVEANLARYGPFEGSVEMLEGWFHETLPGAAIDKLALVRLDGDLYSSTMDALKALMPRLEPGGFVIVDDYHIAGCREAITEFLVDSGWHGSPAAELVRVDDDCVFFRKPLLDG